MRTYIVLALSVALAAAAFGFTARHTDAASTPNAGGPYSGQVGQPIQFSGVYSLNAVSYLWNFGDGTTGTGITPTKSYTTAGVYTVTLTTADEFGATAVTTTAATIGPLPGTTVLPSSTCIPVLVNGVVVCSGFPYGTANPSIYTYPFCIWYRVPCLLTPIPTPVTTPQTFIQFVR